MRVVIQRVSKASVTVENNIVGQISQGYLILVGFETEDTQEDIEWITHKIINLRIFNDEKGVMNKSIIEINGQILLVSQFTLHAQTKKGNRPSYIKAARPELAKRLFDDFKTEISKKNSKKIECGIFGADMKVELLNDGPVTVIIDSKNKE